MELSRVFPADRWLRRFRMMWALVVLLPFLALVAIISGTSQAGYLLFPVLVAMGYSLFQDPFSGRATVRGIVIGPVAGAVIGALAMVWIPGGTARLVIVAALGILTLYWLKSELTPALGVALLTLLAGSQASLYALSVTLAMSALAAIFFAWRRYIYERAIREPEEERDTAPEIAIP